VSAAARQLHWQLAVFNSGVSVFEIINSSRFLVFFKPLFQVLLLFIAETWW
jgi:hypothetical protein